MGGKTESKPASTIFFNQAEAERPKTVNSRFWLVSLVIVAALAAGLWTIERRAPKAAPVVPAVPVQPLYLHVPPGHAKHWRKHCHEYHACNRPVYFVRSAEYEPGFNMERWRAEHEHGHHGEHEHGDRGEHGHGDRDDHEREHRDN